MKEKKRNDTYLKDFNKAEGTESTTARNQAKR